MPNNKPLCSAQVNVADASAEQNQQFSKLLDLYYPGLFGLFHEAQDFGDIPPNMAVQGFALAFSAVMVATLAEDTPETREQCAQGITGLITDAILKMSISAKPITHGDGPATNPEPETQAWAEGTDWRLA